MQELVINLPKDDADVTLVFPGGEKLVVQARPSNADGNYNGSLDVILPDDSLVTVFRGDDLDKSEAPDASRPHERVGKQIVSELPGDYAGDNDLHSRFFRTRRNPL